MTAAALHLSSALLLATTVAAQLHPGMAAPPLLLQWGDSVPVATTGDAAPAAAVIFFHRSVGAAAALDGQLLQHLRRQHLARGMELVVVVPAAAPLPPAFADVHVGVDADGRLRDRWLDPALDCYVVVVAAGRVAWIGRPGNGLCARVDDVLAQRLDPAATAELWQQRCTLLHGFVDSPGAESRDLALGIVARRPTDGVSWALCYLAESQKLGNKSAAELTLGAALEVLPRDPRSLAAFADLLLRGDRHDKALGPRLAAATAAAAAAWPDDLRVQLARLRALVRAGDGRAVGRLANVLARKVQAHAESALEFIDILVQDEEPAIHKELGARALEHAAGQVDARQLAAARYLLALRCNGDAGAARELVNDYVEHTPGRAVLNNDAWALLTDLRTMGRFDGFALALVQRLLQQQDALEPFELDTVALAMFANGQFADAVEQQAKAIARGGDDAGYAERLAVYRAAAATASAPR